MAALTPASLRALANLRAFTPQPTNYARLPLARRAAVLILLFADRQGDLRVVLTIRSAGLKSYTGQAALPGGKADALSETPWQTARREAFEEIGLPESDDKLPPGYTMEHLTELPMNLAMTELGVRPCVAFLRAPDPRPGDAAPPDAASQIIPKLDPREVAAVFTAPFYNLLRERDLDEDTRSQVPGQWYVGSWHSWYKTAWRMHQFFVPVSSDTVFLASSERRRMQREREEQKAEEKKRKQEAEARSNPSPTKSGRDTPSSHPDSKLSPQLPRQFYIPTGDALAQPRYRVFGMTARILVDCARVAYGEEPEYEHTSHFGDEEIIAKLLKIGRLGAVRKAGEIMTKEVIQKAEEVKL